MKELEEPQEDRILAPNRFIVFIMGLTYAGALIFGYFESNFFNTYLDHVLGLTPLHISLMVSLSAIMGLIMNFIWGIKSDNTRTRFGRRRPFLLFGVAGGIIMILFSFSQNYVLCLILDAFVLSICSNGYYAGQRSLIPDLTEIERRGQVNGIVSIIGSLGLILAISTTLIANEFFTEPRGTGNIVNHEGHIFLITIGAACFMFFGLLGFLFIREKDPILLPPKRKFTEVLRETLDLKELKKQKEFFKIIIAITIFKTGLAMILPFLFNFIFSLALETLELMLVLAFGAPCLFISIFFLGRACDKFGRRIPLAPVISISSLGFFTLPFISNSLPLNIPLLILSISLVFVGAIGLLVPLDAWSQDLLPADKRGQFLGILNIINTVSQLIGAIIGGILATIYGIAWIFAFVPIFLIGSLPFFMRVKETLIFD